LRIYYERHEKYPNLVEFSYEPGADFKTKIPCEARGIILDEFNNWNVVAFPYTKFHTYPDKNCH
jgi:hypothetical protein